jgi:hypothetical protein
LALEPLEVVHDFAAKSSIDDGACLSFHAQIASFASFAADAGQFFLAILHDFR